jgi:hypothetical protein
VDLGYVERESKREVVCCAVFARKAVRTPVSQGAVSASVKSEDTISVKTDLNRFSRYDIG